MDCNQIQKVCFVLYSYFSGHSSVFFVHFNALLLHIQPYQCHLEGQPGNSARERILKVK